MKNVEENLMENLMENLKDKSNAEAPPTHDFTAT